MKRGLSAIVTTTLLVVFTITLGILITVWMRSTVGDYVKEGEKGIETKLTCMNIKMQLEKEGNKIYIKNNGEIEIYGYSAVLYDQNDNSKVFKHENSNIKPYGTTEYPPSPPQTDEILSGKSKIKIIPNVISDEGIISECRDQEMTLQL